MTVLLDFDLPRTLDALVDRLMAETPAGPVEAWLFEDMAARRAAEARLAAVGVAARLRSAYKPLLAFFREEADLGGVTDVLVRYPVHPSTHPDRFLLECYPVGVLFPGVAFRFAAGDEGLDYAVELTRQDGGRRQHSVFAPNVVRPDAADRSALAVSGWLRMEGADGPIEAEVETLLRRALAAVPRQGAIERLAFAVEIGAADEDLGWGDEVVSVAEFMHEELYFAAREALGAATGAASGRLAARPGQIVPDVRSGTGRIRLRVKHEGTPDDRESDVAPLDLVTADRPLGMAQVRDRMAALCRRPAIVALSARSRQGRPGVGLYKPGRGEPVLITAAQHANETSGVVGALRAAERLIDDPDAHFALVPVENLDGYELHHRLRAGNPRHMHHAARYAAAGDDLSASREPPDDERAVRAAALRLSGAQLHINLHGYPAHEWTRPLTGYLPHGFELWTIPKGFFLIVTHHSGWRDVARALVEDLTARMASDADLVAFNATHIAAARLHSREQPFAVVNGFAVTVNESTRNATPLTLITEAPDETVYGDAFRRQHTAQMGAVLHGLAAYRSAIARVPTPAQSP